MAKEVGEKAVEKQLEIMQEQQEKAKEFVDEKVCLLFDLNNYYLKAAKVEFYSIRNIMILRSVFNNFIVVTQVVCNGELKASHL